jgi:formylglycine-generating enzyme required for sulfatase activity
MKMQQIHNLFNQLVDSENKRQLDQARRLLDTIFGTLLKSVYSLVRGQAPSRIMHRLMALEIEIGGEDGDFKAFDNSQMIALFNRGEVLGYMQTSFCDGDHLAAAMDLDAIGRWIETPDGETKQTSLAAVQFVHHWLVLFAEETGIVDSVQADGMTWEVSSKPPGGETNRLPRKGEPFTDPVTGMAFVYVPGGTFSMGDTLGDGVEDETPVHEVTLSSFYMAIHPVTQAQWNSLMSENPSNFVGDQHPVEQVALDDVMTFIDKLNGASPKEVHFDLPSEAQWEYAARSGGLEELYAGGQDPETVAWFENTYHSRTAPVGTKSPNGLGLYDMSGNVWEWCRDIYHESAYRHHDKTDPVCTTGGRDRVIRGGSWHLDAWSARCSRRFRFDPELFGPALGFRLVMVVRT